MDYSLWIELIATVGFPIACVLACGGFIYKMVIRDRDEAVSREEKLISANVNSAEALEKVAETIEKTNETNYALSETNRLLVEKMEDKLVSMDGKLDKILDGKN